MTKSKDSATAILGFETIKTLEQAEQARDYAEKLTYGIQDAIAFGDSCWHPRNAKEHARELHRLLVALERFWG